MRKLLFFVAIVLSLILLKVALHRANLAKIHTFIVNINVPVTLKWRLKTNYHKFIYSSITMADDVIYMGSIGKCLYAVDKNTGEQRWELYEKKALFSAPSVVDGVVYVGKYDYSGDIDITSLEAIDAASGKLKWRFRLGGVSPVVYSPTVANGTVYIGSPDYHIYAIDAKTGEFKWRFVDEFNRDYEPGDYFFSPAPLFAENVVYIANGNNLYAFDANSGEFKWRFETRSQVTSTPAMVNDMVYVGSSDSYLYAIDADSGKLIWGYEAEGIIFSPIITDNIIYFGDTDYYLYAVDINSGELKWRFKTGNEITASPSVVDGVIYVGSWFFSLYALDSKSGKKKWRYEAEGPIDSNIIVVDDVIYYGCRDGYLYALEIKK